MTVRRLLALLVLALAMLAGSSAHADPVTPIPVDLWGDTYCVRAGLDPTLNLPTVCVPLP